MLGAVLSSLFVSGALGQVTSNENTADEALKTCLQRQYEPAQGKRVKYRSGDALAAACRIAWDEAKATCAAQPGRTPEVCEARMTMMLLGFVPMH